MGASSATGSRKPSASKFSERHIHDLSATRKIPSARTSAGARQPPLQAADEPACRWTVAASAARAIPSDNAYRLRVTVRNRWYADFAGGRPMPDALRRVGFGPLGFDDFGEGCTHTPPSAGAGGRSTPCVDDAIPGAPAAASAGVAAGTREAALLAFAPRRPSTRDNFVLRLPELGDEAAIVITLSRKRERDL